jgi:LysR family transcriptional regulator for bpeEF and oprC
VDNLGDIVTFVRVVASGSFVAAANQLGVTPSAVSKSVSRLEERLGIRLLNRTTRSLSPTDVGTAFYARCQALVTQLQDAEAEVVETRQRPRGRLRVDMPLTLAREYVIPALPRFLAQFPDVTLQLSFSDRLSDMVNEAIDICVRVGELTDSRLVARRLWNPDVVAVASPDYLARRGTPVEPEDLKDHDCVRFFNPNNGRVIEWAMARNGVVKQVSVSGRILVDSPEALLETAISGAGIAPVMGFMTERPVAAGLLVRVLPEWRYAIERPVSALFVKDRHPTPKVQAFLEFLLSLFPASQRT